MAPHDNNHDPAPTPSSDAPADIDPAVVRGELALLEDLCHQQRRSERAVVRDLLVVVRGTLPDGRMLWSGEDFTFGVLTASDVDELGLDSTGTCRALVTVASRGCRHVIARVLVHRMNEPAHGRL